MRSYGTVFVLPGAARTQTRLSRFHSLPRTLSLLTALVVVVALASAASASQGVIPLPFSYSVEPQAPLQFGVPIPMVFSFAPADPGCDSTQVEIVVDGNLIFRGQTSWTAYFGKEMPAKPDTLRFEVVVARNDTCGFKINFVCPEFKWDAHRYFVTRGDSLVMLKGDPRWIDHDFGHSLPGDYPPGGHWVKGDFAEDSIYIMPQIPPDTPKQTLHRSATKAEAEQLEMIRLEKTPLTNATAQIITVDGQQYKRSRGEYKFHTVEPITDQRAHIKQKMDSAALRDAGRLHDMWLDLRDSAKYEWAMKHVDSLIPTSVPGIFHALITKQTMNKLAEKDIEMHQWLNNLPGKHKLGEPEWQPNDTIDIMRPDRKRTKSPQSSLFYESFDGYFPSGWTLVDSNSMAGYDYWYYVFDCQSTSGWYSAWCAGMGDMTDCANYDNNMDAYMYLTYAIDVTDWTNLWLTYSVLFDTELGFDYLEVCFSFDRQNWSPLACHEGYSGGWDYPEYPILKTGNTLYLRFQFYSDYSGTAMGVYVDDVEVTGLPVPKPNLVPYDPPGWSDEIVASPTTGTNQDATVYGGEPTYVDFAVRNSGDAEAGSFYCGLYVDNSLVAMPYVGGLYAAEWREVEDHVLTIGTGQHTLNGNTPA